MMSEDLIIRTERPVIDVVIGLEGEVKLLRTDFEDFKREVRDEFKAVRSEMAAEFKAVRSEMKEQYLTVQGEINQLTGEVRGLERTVETMTNIFSLGLALVAICVAIAPLLRDLFTRRQEERESTRRLDQLESKMNELLESRWKN